MNGNTVDMQDKLNYVVPFNVCYVKSKSPLMQLQIRME